VCTKSKKVLRFPTFQRCATCTHLGLT